MVDCLTDGEVDFLMGLIAGEASFKIALQNEESRKFNVRSNPIFTIEMAEQSNILPLLKSKTGIGNIYEFEGKEDNWSDTERWGIYSEEDIQKLITIIESRPDSPFWETDKGKTFDEWQRARKLKEEIGTGDPEAVKEIIDIAKSLNGTDQGRPAEEWKAIVDEAVEERSD